MLTQLFVILIAYALGCISVGYYLVRWRTGQDVRAMGSGATGGRNVGRVLGRGAMVATGLGDGFKGVLAMVIALWFKLESWALALVMIAVLAGHIWPAQLEFRGGKGLSTAFGAVLVYDYRIALLTAVVAIPLLVISRRARTVAFMLGVATSPLIAFLLNQTWEIVRGIALLVVMILYAHRENIRESWKGK